MKLIPFGEVLEDRVKLARDHNLIELKWSFNRMTERARKYYEPISFIEYLQGKRERPLRLTEAPKQPEANKQAPPVKQKEPEVPQVSKPTSREVLIEQLLAF